MTYIIVYRNPHSKKLHIIVEDEDDALMAEFDSEDEAVVQAERMSVCRTYGYQVVPIQ